MCEAESNVSTGNGVATSSIMNVSCPEGITEAKGRHSLLTKTSSDPQREEGKTTSLEDEPSSGDVEVVRRGSVGTRDPLGVTPRFSIVDTSSETEGVDPFKPTDEGKETNGDIPMEDQSSGATALDSSSKKEERRDSKAVSFKEPEKEDSEEDVPPAPNSNDCALPNSTSTSASDGSKEQNGAVERKRSSSNKQQRSLAENPVYRLSMKLSPSLFSAQEIPGASQHREAEKAGYLTKLSGRSFPYIAQWKRRYCVLSKGRLYYYEREDSKSGEKSNGVINLEYFDQVAEAAPKDCKKATNVFVITSQDRSFFDPGRHLFSADTLPDMKDWVRKLQSALEQIRNNTRPATTTAATTSPSSTSASPSSKKDGSGKKAKEQAATEGNPQTNTKERKKKKDSHRPRKSARVGDIPESQPKEESSKPETQRQEAEVPAMASPMGIQLPGMVSPRGGVALPGLSPTRKEPPPEETKDMATSTSDANQQTEEGLPKAGPTLSCVTKLRNKGPQGRRAPQNRRTNAALAYKKRASSLSALEYQDLNDNSSEAQWLNKSLDMLDDEHPCAANGDLAHSGCAPSSLPYKAYNYSSDEDMDYDGENSHSDSFPTSASAMPPPPPPRSASYGLELRQNPPLGQAGRQVLHRSLGDAQGSGGDVRGSRRSLRDGRMAFGGGDWQGSSLGEQWIGSQSSLGLSREIVGNASPVMDDLDNLLMNQSIQQTSMALDSASESGSEGSTCRQANDQQQSNSQHQPATKKSKHHHHHRHHHHSGPDLTRFAMAVKHLQRHVVEIDRAVFGITGEVTGTRQEVTSLKEAVLALQADTDTITSTLSHLTEEAISAQQKITFATQEAEKVRKIANMALKEAEQARQEQLKSKKEYESLLTEMKGTIKSLKETQRAYAYGYLRATSPMPNKERAMSPTPKQGNSNIKTSVSKMNIEIKSPEMNFKPPETSSPKSSRVGSESKLNSSSTSKASESSAQSGVNSKSGEEPIKTVPSKSNWSNVENQTSTSSSPRTSGSSAAGLGPPPVAKSNSLSQVTDIPKIPSYQSLFTRPSSIISSIAQRSSLTKSVSFADQKEEEKGQEKSSEASIQKEEKEDDKKEKREKEKKTDKNSSSIDRKDRKEHKHHQKEEKVSSHNTNSKERKHKERKDHGSIDRKEKKHRHKDRKSSHRGSKEEEHMISNLSLDDIPMADDNSNELLDRVGMSDKKDTPPKVSSLSNSTQTPSNFSLGKSSSSPVVAPGLLASKPKSLPLNKDHHKTELCNSNASTPDSSAPPSSFPQVLPSSSRPANSYVRSSSTHAVVEVNHSTGSPPLRSLHRPGSTPGPLARQGSMTTVPEDKVVANPPRSRPGVFAISRQSSSPNIPLQRQNSGAAIPLQRQHSLGTVPEEGRLPRQDSLMSVPEERPIADQTLPLSPSQSMTCFPVSPSASATTITEHMRRTMRASMELVTGPVLSGSAMQEASATGTLAVLTDPEEEPTPTATSTLKKDQKTQRDVDGVAI